MPVTWTSPPPTRILSWSQLVREADPSYTRLSLQPWVYEFSNGRLFIDTLPTYTPFADGLANDNGVLYLIPPNSGWPTSPVGLVAGSFYSNGGVVTIAGTFTPVAGAPVYLPLTGAVQLLAMGGVGLPTVDPGRAGQLWNAYGEVWVSFGPPPYVPQPMPPSLINDGGVLMLASYVDDWPLSSATPGAVYDNGFAVSVVLPTTPVPAPPVYFGSITAPQLLALGGANLPITGPLSGSLQLWNNGGLVCVA